MPNRSIRTLAALAVLCLTWVSNPARAETINVVASFSILGDMVRNVTGDRATVTTIVGPNADAHLYSPNAADAKATAAADVIFVNGLGFETWSQALIETSGTEAPVFVATRGITPLQVEGSTDPHAWNALPNGVIYVRNIATAMADVDPANAETYAANAESYIAQLTALHTRAGEVLAQLPSDRRTVVTAHDAFGYLASTYGLTFLAPVGIDTEAEPSAKELAELIDQLKDRRVAGLFVENISNPALVEQIARETGLTIGGRLFSDALSVPDGPAPSYLAMYDHNLSMISAALQGGS